MDFFVDSLGWLYLGLFVDFLWTSCWLPMNLFPLSFHMTVDDSMNCPSGFLVTMTDPMISPNGIQDQWYSGGCSRGLYPRLFRSDTGMRVPFFGEGGFSLFFRWRLGAVVMLGAL